MAAGTSGGTSRPRSRAVTAVPDKPVIPRTTFSMDTAEREDGQSAPFILELEGVRYQLADVLELSADDLLPVGESGLLLLERVGPQGDDDRTAFSAALRRQPTWRVRDAAVAYYNHYGVPSDQGEGAA